jgi:hypothetical protein
MDSQERFEFKFLLSAQSSEVFFKTLGAGLTPDLLGGPTGVYPVVSLYYDTPERRCYWEAWRKMPSRRKLRVRVYGSRDGQIAPTSFIEVKHKVDGLGFKRRVQTELHTALGLVNGLVSGDTLPSEDRRTLEETRRMVREEGFAPSCMIRYLRHAYWLSLGELDAGCRAMAPLRITLDSGLQARFDDLEPTPDDRRFTINLLPEGTRILEIKGKGAIPFPLALQLAKAGIRSASVSKYCKAIGHRLQSPRDAKPGPF